jgi:hypothetical protein
MVTIGVPARAAEVYKWVDERGVTNYSSEPPAHVRAAGGLAVVEDRLSVYTPDKLLLQAVEAARQRAIEDVRTGRYQRQLEAEHLARMRTSSAPPAAAPGGYDPCLDAANIDLCENRVYGGWAFGVGPLGFPQRHLPKARGRGHGKAPVIIGTVAGNKDIGRARPSFGHRKFGTGFASTGPRHPGGRSFGRR